MGLSIGAEIGLLGLQLGEKLAPVFVKSDQGRTVLSDAEPLINALADLILQKIEAKQAAKQAAQAANAGPSPDPGITITLHPSPNAGVSMQRDGVTLEDTRHGG